MARPTSTRLLALLAAPALAGALAVLPGGAGASSLQGRIDSSRNRDRQLQGAIGSESARIHALEGRLGDVRGRLDGLQRSLDLERAQLDGLQRDLRRARLRLVTLRRQFRRDRRALAAQLVGQYKTPRPDIVGVVMSAHGFAELLETASDLRRLARQNTTVVHRVHAERDRVTGEARRLSRLETRQAQVTRGAQLQRDEVSSLKRQVVDRQVALVRARSANGAELTSVRSTRKRLETKLQKELARQAKSIPGAGTGGSSGFFPAAGTNYTQGVEPQIAQRLGKMGKALGLHLIGLSGYRTPQHSVEVGGFADDPHTQGRASDTPGAEGVPERTLNAYGLTRPFAGAAEANHIQLAG